MEFSPRFSPLCVLKATTGRDLATTPHQPALSASSLGGAHGAACTPRSAASAAAPEGATQPPFTSARHLEDFSSLQTSSESPRPQAEGISPLYTTRHSLLGAEGFNTKFLKASVTWQSFAAQLTVLLAWLQPKSYG